MPFLSSKLPAYSGEYSVGVVDIEVPVAKRNISEVVFKDTRRPAFEIDTVLFSLYYPAVKEVKTAKPHHAWVDKIGLQAEGYARFAGLDNFFMNGILSFALWTFVGSTTVPANVDVPIHGTIPGYQDYSAEVPMENDGLPTFPVIVFSHGAASTRTSYTQWCGELASRGFVVAAIEHRDGSGPSSTVMLKDGPSREVTAITPYQLSPEPKSEDFKAIQLAFRQAEVEETVKALRRINSGFGSGIFNANSRGEGKDLATWGGRLNMQRVAIAGHSYGATLALQTLKGAPSHDHPFVGGMIFDPGKHSGPLNDDIDVPIMVIHSQSWSAKMSIFQGRPHFTVVKDLVNRVMRKEKGRAPQYAWFMTSKGTSHPSMTDAPLIEPFLLSWSTGSTIDVREGVMQYVKVSQEFMRYLEDGHRTGVLAEDITHPSYDEDARDEKTRNRMSRQISRYWQIHVAPSTECPFPGMCGVEPEERG